MIFVFMFFISFLFLAFRDLSSMRTHFWPFTGVLSEIRFEVTRKVRKPRMTLISRMDLRWRLIQTERNQMSAGFDTPGLATAGRA
jgi:hypothetical protein